MDRISCLEAIFECRGRSAYPSPIALMMRAGAPGMRSRAPDFRVSTRCEFTSPHSGALNALDIDAGNNNYALVGGADGQVSLYDLRDAFADYFRKERCTIGRTKLSDRVHGHARGSAITSVQWFPKDCGAFATSSYDMSCKLWDTETFRSVVDFKFMGFVNCCRMHYDGNIISCGIEGNDIRLCDLRTGGNTHVLSAHKRVATSIDFCPSNSNIMASSSLDKSVKIWDLRKASSRSVLLSLDWRQDLTSKYCDQRDAATAHDGGAMSLKFLPCGTELVTCGADRCVRTWDPATGELLDSKANLTTDWNTSHYDIDISHPLPGITRNCVLFVPGRKEGDIGMIQLERRRGAYSFGSRLQEMLVGHVRMVRGMKYMPMRNKLVSIGNDGMILLWEPKHVNDKSGSSFSGNDPEEVIRNKRKQPESGAGAIPADTGNHRSAELDDIDRWSSDDENSIAEYDGSESTLSRTEVNGVNGDGTARRFLPPIIQQILEDENWVRENNQSGRMDGVGRRNIEHARQPRHRARRS